MRFDPVECGKRMKALRESKNLTQMQLAEQLNISLNHVKALEHARRLFSIDLVIEISAFFDVSLDYLLLGKTQSTSKAASELNAAIEILERIAFLNATESTGLQLGLDSYRAPWKIICIRTAFKEYKTYGADLYKEALTMLARGWEGDPDSLRSGILQGMMRFVALYQGEYDPERLVKRLHTVHPMTLVRDEKSLSGTVRYKYMMLILRTYNGASRRRNLPIKP